MCYRQTYQEYRNCGPQRKVCTLSDTRPTAARINQALSQPKKDCQYQEDEKQRYDLRKFLWVERYVTKDRLNVVNVGELVDHVMQATKGCDHSCVNGKRER
jgi:hypothetical protein